MDDGGFGENRLRFDENIDQNLRDAIVLAAPIRAIYASGTRGLTRSEALDEYVGDWQADIVEFLGPIVEGLSSEPPEPSYYLIPPAAGEYTEIIFTIASNIDAFIQSIDAYIGLGGALIALAGRRKERREATEFTGTRDPLEPLMIGGIRNFEAMCLYHAYANYTVPDNTSSISVESLVRHEFVGTAERPSPRVQFTIQVTIDEDDYIYVVTAGARVLEHFGLSNGLLRPLELPDWVGERWEGDGKIAEFIPTFHVE